MKHPEGIKEFYNYVILQYACPVSYTHLDVYKRQIEGGYTADTPAAIVYKATWPEQKTFVCTVGTLAKTAAENNITKTALMIIGDTVAAAHYDRSKLYDPEFTTEFREAVKSKTHQMCIRDRMCMY